MAQKFHIGKNGPALCRANPDRPGGRACQFGEDRHGTESEMTVLWEHEQEELHGSSLLRGVSSAELSAIPEVDSPEDSESPIAVARRTLGKGESYHPKSGAVRYREYEREIARRLALAEMSTLSHSPVLREHDDWYTEGFSSCRRYELEDGSVGYFKAFSVNSFDEQDFVDYGMSSLAASISEVNSYRMAKILGEGFDELVPETAFREVRGEMGTIQREAKEDPELTRNFRKSPELQEDYRKAAILDFVIGNLDRHGDNFVYGAEGTGPERLNRLRLIDNSFSFPGSNYQSSHLNSSTFSSNRPAGSGWDNDGEWNPGYAMDPRGFKLRSEEREALERAGTGAKAWLKEKTIAPNRGRELLKRIDYLLKEDRISDLSAYLSLNS